MSEELPFHLQGNYAPVKDELTETSLEVEGAIPPELCGLYVRNGSNPITGTSEHWFMGNGMVHGVQLEAGKARWYRNRYVRTKFLEHPDAQRVSATGDIDRELSAANTHIVEHAGKLLALEEGSFPYVLDRELETKGVTDFDGRLTTAFSAHPHICPVTGEMLSFGYGQLPPYLTYLRVSPDGKLVQSEQIEVPGPTMMHDFAITESRAIFMDLPVVFDIQAALAGTMPFSWSDDYGARMGIMPRTGTNADVKWFDVDPCYVFHGMNAWDEGDRVVYDAVRMSEVWRNAGEMSGVDTVVTLHRFTFDLSDGSVKEETLSDRPLEFPRVAPERVGRKNRFGFTVAFEDTSEGGTPGIAGHYKFDLKSGTSQLHSYGKGRAAAEPVFVPAEGADPDSDEGWVLSYVYDEATRKTDLVIADAQDFEGPDVARVKLPQRVPFGFHGSYIPDAR